MASTIITDKVIYAQNTDALKKTAGASGGVAEDNYIAAYCKDHDMWYVWISTSDDADNVPTVLMPDGNHDARAGRWVRQ